MGLGECGENFRLGVCVLVVVGFFPLYPFQGVLDVGERWDITRGPARRTRKIRNTVEVNIVRIGSEIFCRITHSLLRVTSKELGR